MSNASDSFLKTEIGLTGDELIYYVAKRYYLIKRLSLFIKQSKFPLQKEALAYDFSFSDYSLNPAPFLKNPNPNIKLQTKDLLPIWNDFASYKELKGHVLIQENPLKLYFAPPIESTVKAKKSEPNLEDVTYVSDINHHTYRFYINARITPVLSLCNAAQNYARELRWIRIQLNDSQFIHQIMKEYVKKTNKTNAYEALVLIQQLITDLATHKYIDDTTFCQETVIFIYTALHAMYKKFSTIFLSRTPITPLAYQLPVSTNEQFDELYNLTIEFQALFEKYKKISYLEKIHNWFYCFLTYLNEKKHFLDLSQRKSV